jgi:hypothetical protein
MAPTETDEVLQQCAELVRDELDVLQVGLFMPGWNPPLGVESL